MVKKDKNNEQGKIDQKYNISVYWSFLKKQKKFFLLVLIIAILLEALNLVNSFLFKIIVDRGTDFSKGVISKVQFIDILLIVFVVWLISVIFKLVFTWFKIHLNNRLENNLIIDLKEKFFNHIFLIRQISR